MIDIKGLPQVQSNLYRSLGSGGNSSPLTAQLASGAALPSDQVASSAFTNVQQPAEQPQRIDIFVVTDNVFSLYKLPNGELFSKVRNLKTGEENIFPHIDTLTYFDAIRGNRGMFVEKRV